MKKLYFLFLSLVLFKISLFSQSCVNGYISLYNQALINSFPNKYPGCKEIIGDVFISGEDITNLQGLQQITFISGTLTIGYCPLLTNLEGLDSLNSIGGGLTINTGDLTHGITSFDGLENLKSVQSLNISYNKIQNFAGLKNLSDIESEVFIMYNDQLKDFSGLEKITHVPGNFQIENNQSLESLNGLNNLTYAGILSFSNNPPLNDISALHNFDSAYFFSLYNSSITDLNGLENLQKVTNLGLGDNPYLISLNGLGSITSLQGLSLNNNPSLTNLDALSTLRSIQSNGLVYIVNNDALTSLSFLDSAVLPTSMYSLQITDCDSLAVCNSNSVCNYLLGGGKADIDDNAEGCSSVVEVKGQCQVLPVELLKLTGQRNLNTVYLNWITVSENNSSYFSIERSSDGVNYTTTGQVSAYGNSNSQLEYHFIDNSPSNDITLYRLKLVDKDGKHSYSNVVSIGKAADKIILFPNPAKDIAFIKGENVRTVMLYNMANKKVLAKENETNASTISINIGNLSKGTYWVVIKTDTGYKETKKLLIQ